MALLLITTASHDSCCLGSAPEKAIQFYGTFHGLKKKKLRQYSTTLWSLDLCQRSRLWGSSRKIVLLVQLWAYLYLLRMVTSACWRESKYVPTMCRLRLSWNGEAVTTYVLCLICLEYYENMKIKLKRI